MDKFKLIARRSVCMSENFKEAKEAVSRLSAEEKAILLQEMLGQGQQIILGGGNFFTADVVMQIQAGDVDLSEIFTAAAHRVSKEKVDRGSN